MVERLHRTLKSSLMAQDEREHWAGNLSLVLLGICATFEPDVDSCPAELVYDGPYTVLFRSDKAFKTSVYRRHETVSIDRLKSAFV